MLLFYPAVLTASADGYLQVAFDNSAAFERLSRIYGVDDLPVAHFIAQAIAGGARHAEGNTDGWNQEEDDKC